MDNDESGLPPAHPAFHAHFTDPLYDAEGVEFAPFGTPARSALVREWASRRTELAGGSITVREMLFVRDLDEDDIELVLLAGSAADVEDDEAELAETVVGAGFSMLRLVGAIDEDGRQLVLSALNALFTNHCHVSTRVLLTMYEDLDAWTG